MLKTLHCPNIVGGNVIHLSNAERELGLDSTIINVSKDYLGYSDNQGAFSREILRWRTYLKDFSTFDNIHYNYGQTLLPSRVNISGGTLQKLLRTIYNGLYAKPFEMKDILRAKRNSQYISVTFQGSDARRRYDNQGKICPLAEFVRKDYFTDKYDAIKVERIKLFKEYANKIFYVNPDLANFLPDTAEFMPYCNVDSNAIELLCNHNRADDNKFKIIHAPTHSDVKGTTFIRKAIADLQQKYDFIEYKEVVNLDHSELQKIIASCDLLIDQLIIGWYGGISVEAMSLGIPVIAYIDNAQLGVIPDEMRDDLPIISSSIDSLFDVLETITTGSRKELPSDETLKKFVLKWHNPVTIAKKINNL